jgi:hypothetical protein
MGALSMGVARGRLTISGGCRSGHAPFDVLMETAGGGGTGGI